MANKLLKGRKPVSEKPKASSKVNIFRQRNMLELPEWVLKDLEDKRLEARWIDARQMAENGNMHRNMWEVYKRPTDTMSGETPGYGLPPDGTIRRGTMVLGCRSIELGDGHREMLREKADRQSLKNVLKSSRQEFQSMSRDAAGVSFKETSEVGKIGPGEEEY